MGTGIMRHLDLCSGIGGFALGFEWAGLSKPVMFCDIEPWSRQVLAKHWPDVPIAEDIKELSRDPDGLIPDCDIITAGYPCQPFALPGKRDGTKDDRHLWPFIFPIVQAKRPAWCVFENVYGHVSLGLDEVLSDLEGEGYAARTFIVPACAVDAPHRRDRIWIIARKVSNPARNRWAVSGSRNKRRDPNTSLAKRVRGKPCRVHANVRSRTMADTDSESNTFGRQHKPDAEQSVCGRNNKGRGGSNDWCESGTEQDATDVADTKSIISNVRGHK